jgi:hypothetical protein
MDASSLPLTDSFQRPDSPLISTRWIEQQGDFGLRDQRLINLTTGTSVDELTSSECTPFPFSDRFDGANYSTFPNKWTHRTTSGQFVVVNDRLVAPGSATSLATVNNVSQTNVTLEADVDVSQINTGEIGLVARYNASPSEEMYVGSLTNRGGIFRAEIHKFYHGSWTNLAFMPVVNGKGTLRFEVEGSDLRLLLDGEVVAAARDSSITSSGAVGIRGWGTATVDNYLADHLQVLRVQPGPTKPDQTLLSWLPIGQASAYHVVLTDTGTQTVLFRDWVYDTNLELALPNSSYFLQVAAPSRAYASRHFAVPNHDIQHAVQQDQSVQLSWSSFENQSVFHVVVERDSNQAVVFQDWVYDSTLRLNLPVDGYTVRVAAPGEPYSRYTFKMPEVSGYTYLAPGHGIAYWPTNGSGEPYFIRIKDSTGQVVFQDYVYDSQIEINRQPDLYLVEFAAPGESFVPIAVDLGHFSQRTFTPLSPVGPTTHANRFFNWYPVPSATAYFFQLRRSDGEVINSHWVYGTETFASLPPGDYQWRVIPINRRNEKAGDQDWVSVSVVGQLGRENILGIAPDVTVPSALANLNYPETALEAPDGTIYVLDTLSNAIRRVRDGQVELFAGTLESGYNGDGFRTDVMFNRPGDLLFAPDGNLLILDSGNYLIRKLDLTTGAVTTIAGIPGVSQLPSSGALAKDSPIGIISAIAFAPDGSLLIPMFVSGSGDPPPTGLFVLTSDGVISEHPSIQLTEKVFDLAITSEHVDLLSAGMLRRVYFSGGERSVTALSAFPGGILYRPETQTTLVGNFDHIVEFDAQLNGTTVATGFAHVAAITRSANGYLVTDGDRGAILSYRPNGERIPDATIGGGAQGISAILTSARYDADTLLFLENQKGYIYAYSLSTGTLRIFAGNGRLEEASTGVHSSQTGFYYANAIAVDSEKNVYVAENYRILKIGVDGMMSLFAGSRDPGDNPSGTPALEARFTSIRGMAFDAQDNLYVADYGNNKVKKISNGVVDLVAGNGVAGPAEYGSPAAETSLNHPVGLLPLADGTVLIADSWNNTIVRIERDGRLTHVAGSQRSTIYQGNGSFSGDGGPATAADLNTPGAMAYSEDGSTLYIVDTFNNRIRAVLPDGTITTVWGEGSSGYRPDGSLLNLPSAIMIVGEDLIVCDVGNGIVSRIRIS